ncbi:hypothetical protein GOZ89_06740 [Agrobacterium vitis]|uniref:hypothetical protein n=1 Tax=Agrobacterium vitis TaxID=373 RepID=UPI0012E8782A|nr:hypothetical protein [Agrobacterium vitis]MCF1468876.1 hypothetical protein [Agrobacterium vitis]MVA79108.1 hypothetical protein [Agrobacterium vitis]
MHRKEVVPAFGAFVVVALAYRNDPGLLLALKLAGFLVIVLSLFMIERRWPAKARAKVEAFRIGYTAALGLLIAVQTTLLSYHMRRPFIESLECFALTLLVFFIFSLGLALSRNRRIIK